jgi:uncharacterized lipoprotein YajG
MRILSIAVLTFILAGCATWSTSAIDRTNAAHSVNESETTKDPAEVAVIEGDVTDRRYESLGDITVTVNKTTIFHPDPTPEMVNKKLQEKAANLGADAVIMVRHGKGGISVLSWGSLEGKGRAIRYLD